MNSSFSERSPSFSDATPSFELVLPELLKKNVMAQKKEEGAS
jgi:hypothetical protein